MIAGERQAVVLELQRLIEERDSLQREVLLKEEDLAIRVRSPLLN